MPLTLHQPKGMVHVVDRPIVHYVVDEAVAAGINRIIFIINPRQRQFRQYFDFLLKRDPGEWKRVRFEFAIQKTPLGNGHAILSARKLIKNEPFLLLWSDDIIVPEKEKNPPMATLVNFFKLTGEPIIALEKFPKKELSRMGVVKAQPTGIADDFYRISTIVEKPAPGTEPSNLTIAGRYVITPVIMENLAVLLKQRKFRKGELWLTDALSMHIEKGGRIFGWRYPNKRFDCGSKMGILKAQAYFGIHHQEFGKEFRKYLRTLNT